MMQSAGVKLVQVRHEESQVALLSWLKNTTEGLPFGLVNTPILASEVLEEKKTPVASERSGTCDRGTRDTGTREAVMFNCKIVTQGIKLTTVLPTI